MVLDAGRRPRRRVRGSACWLCRPALPLISLRPGKPPATRSTRPDRGRRQWPVAQGSPRPDRL